MTERLVTQIKQYRLLREVGRGGMGVVYEALDTRDNSRVAVKLLHPWLVAEDPSFRERFEREAHIAALLRSPYTVRLLDFGESDGACFLVLEFVDGQTLAELLAGGRLEPAAALRIATSAARALDEAGARGIVHRDVKPGNILLTRDGAVKVTDFGIARHEGAVGLTHAGQFTGTADYAAPEQARGLADHRSDIYALGAVLYAMLTGHPPYQGATPYETLDLHQHGRLPAAALDAFPEPVESVVRRCLEKDPRDRYQEATELAAALERALAALGHPAPPPATAPPTLMPAADGVAGATTRVAAASAGVPPGPPFPAAKGALQGQGRWLVGTAAAIAVLTVAAFAVVLLRGDGNQPGPSPATPTPAAEGVIDSSPTAGASPAAPAAPAPQATPTPAPLGDLIVARALPSAKDTDLGIFQPGIYIYEPLTRRGQPALAESWEFTPPNTWTFHLLKGVQFHDGSEFTAADVVAAFDLLARTPTNAIGAKAGGTTAPDRYTVRFVTTSTLGDALLAQFDEARIPKAGSDPARHPVGTGMFQFVEYQKNARLVAKRWEGYRVAAAVKTRTITFVYSSDSAARARELLSGHVDVVIGVDPASSGNITQAGFVIESCGTLTIAHTKQVTGGCVAGGVTYETFVKP